MPTRYFRYKGEANTEQALRLAVERALQLGSRPVVVASETGRSALAALRVVRELGAEIRLIAVTRPRTGPGGPGGTYR